MSELRRWAEEGASRRELRALSEARSTHPTSDARKRMLAGVGVGAALGVTTTSTAAAGTGLLGGVFGKALLVTSVAGALGGAAWHFSERQDTSTMPSKAKPVASNLQKSEPAATAPAELGAPPPPLPSAVVPAEAPSRPVSAGASPAASLSAEVAALDRARRALDSQAPREALKELEAYRKRFPRGSLGAEQTVLTIEALLMQGNGARAIALADRFAAAQPQSPYARRAQDLVEAARTK